MKLETWAKFCKILNLLHNGNICNMVFFVICYACYFNLMVTEIVFFTLYETWTMEIVFTWINFHVSQCLNYFIVILIQQMVVSFTKSYKTFGRDFEQYTQVRIACLSEKETRRNYLIKIKQYKFLYDLNIEFNEVFGLSLLSALGSIFVNILCGIAVFSQNLSEVEVLLHVGTFLTQVIISLVSLSEFSFFIRRSR